MWASWPVLMVAGFVVAFLGIGLAIGLSPFLAVLILVLTLPVLILLVSRESGEPGEQAQTGSSGKPSWLRKHWWE